MRKKSMSLFICGFLLVHVTGVVFMEGSNAVSINNQVVPHVLEGGSQMLEHPATTPHGDDQPEDLTPWLTEEEKKKLDEEMRNTLAHDEPGERYTDADRAADEARRNMSASAPQDSTADQNLSSSNDDTESKTEDALTPDDRVETTPLPHVSDVGGIEEPNCWYVPGGKCGDKPYPVPRDRLNDDMFRDLGLDEDMIRDLSSDDTVIEEPNLGLDDTVTEEPNLGLDNTGDDSFVEQKHHQAARLPETGLTDQSKWSFIGMHLVVVGIGWTLLKGRFINEKIGSKEKFM